MASQDETMRLVAELLDKTSGPLKDIQKSLRDTATVAKKMTGDGATGTKDHAKAYGNLRESIEKTRREVSGAFSPAMASLGLATFGVGEAIGKATEQLKKFAEQYTVMRDASRRSGQSVDFLEKMAGTIEDLTGEAPEEAIQNLANMREQMDRLSRQRPDTVNAWRDAYTGLYETLGQDLMGKTLKQQIDLAMRWKEAHPEIAIDKIRDVFRLMGLDQRLATVGLNEYLDADAKRDAWQKAHPYNAKNAEALHEAFDDLRDSIRGIGWQIGETFGDEGAQKIKSLAATVKDASIAFKQLMIIGSWKPFSGESYETLQKRLLDAQGDTPAQNWLDLRMMTPEELKKQQGPLPPGQTKPNAYGTMSQAQKLAAGMSPISFTSGGGSDAENILTRSTKEGMLAAFREWFSSVQSGGGSGGGIQNAAFSPSGGKLDNTPIGQAIRQRLSGGDAGGGTPGVGPGKGTVGKGGDPRGLEGYIRETAAKYGVDPDTAVAVAKSEGLSNPTGDGGTSHGAFQLHTGGGLGDDFQKETGLDPRDSKNERAMIDWTLRNAHRTGWSPYHGAKRTGIGPRAGLGGAPGAGHTDPGPMRADGLKAFIMHHTGGRGTVAGVQETLRQRHLGVEYVMDRDGNIVQTGERGAANIMPGWGPKGQGLNNSNILGMEVIAKNDSDVTPAQVAAAKAFIGKNYPELPVYGHGEVNPGHKEADEGMKITSAIRSDRDLLKASKAAGMTGSGSQKVEGDAHLKVDLNGFPKGTKTDLTYGGLFTQYTLAKGQQMEASETK
jgi:hypothetical protein